MITLRTALDLSGDERTELHDAYLAAFGAPGYDEPPSYAAAFVDSRLPEHAGRPGFRMTVARVDGALAGFAYGFAAELGQGSPVLTGDWLGGHFELVELAVVPSAQGHGLGGRLHDALLADLPHRRALLSTWADPTLPAPRLFRSRGWQVLLPRFGPGKSLYGLRLSP